MPRLKGNKQTTKAAFSEERVTVSVESDIFVVLGDSLIMHAYVVVSPLLYR